MSDDDIEERVSNHIEANREAYAKMGTVDDEPVREGPAAGKYNEFVLIDERFGELSSGEYHVATVTDQGVYFEHDWMDGGQFVSHEDFRALEAFRQEFLREIGREDEI